MWFAFALLLPILAGCGEDATADSSNKRVSVFAAASMKDGLTDLAKQFKEAHPGTDVTMSFGGSQDLAMQIQKGAPVNIFISADYSQMQLAGASGRIPTSSVQELAENSLVVAAWPRSHVRELQDLAAPHTRVIMAAAQVPAGAYAHQALNKLQDALHKPGFAAAVLRNVVSYEQDVRTVLQKVEMGEADAGVIYRTDASSSHGKVRTILIPAQANVTSRYWIAQVDQWYDTAKGFVSYARSPDGQSILAKHGFLHAAK